ncbi:MAG: hypothetical protein ACFFCW_40215 [Candidatus Hodarchaeota archaeon]
MNAQVRICGRAGRVIAGSTRKRGWLGNHWPYPQEDMAIRNFTFAERVGHDGV